jgi:dihydroorotate dehydrogenase (fumarate)
MDIRTSYMGLNLKSPLIAGSSGMTRSLETILEFEKNGVGAIVLKSLFEEQILHEIDQTYTEASGDSYPEALDYIRSYSKEKSLGEYLALIENSKKTCSIPIIASINCSSANEWTSFAKKIESAGADALELNMFILPSDPNKEGIQNEEMYFKIFREVKNQISIPIALKISSYFSGLARFTTKISWDGPAALVLFNRFFAPDFDIDKLKVVPSAVFSTPEELYTSLRWVAMLSDRIYCDIASSTGVHDGTGMIKQLLAGAKAVQVTSAFYKHGPAHATVMLKELEAWMLKHQFNSIEDFRGKMSYKKADNPATLERVQFMKYFSGIE